MHLGIDIREACRERPTGKGKWTQGFVRELLTRDVRLSLFSDASIPDAWNEDVKKAGAHVVQLPERGLAWHRKVAGMLKPSGIDAYVSTVSYLVPSLAPRSVACIPVVHDLIAFRNEPHDRRAKFIERLTLRRALKRSARVWTVSEATKRDVLARYPSLDASRIHAIFAGGGDQEVPLTVADGSTIVSIATLCPRKNQLRLIKAFAALPAPLRSKARLVLVGGRGWDDDEIVRLAQATDGVSWQGYMNDAECDALLRRSAVFAYPSLYEGFGLPLLEAMRRGIPALTSDRGSLKEVAGEAALYVDPEDDASIARGLERLLTDDALRGQLIDAGRVRCVQFSWKRSVDLALETLQS